MANGRLTLERCADLLSRFLHILRRGFGDDLLAVAVFGSVARGEGRDISDVDMLVIHTPSRPSAADRFVEAVRDLRRTPEYSFLRDQGFLPDPAPVFYTPAQLQEHPWLLLDIVDHGVVLCDSRGLLAKELDAVRSRLRALGARKVTLPNGTWYWDLKPDWKPGETITL